LTPFINAIYPFYIGFLCYFWQGIEQLFPPFYKEKYTKRILDFSTPKVENRVEKMNNSAQKPLILWEIRRGKLYFSEKEYTKDCTIFTFCR